LGLGIKPASPRKATAGHQPSGADDDGHWPATNPVG